MTMIERIRNEPAVAMGLVQAVLGLVLAFGLDLSNEQVGAIMAVAAAVLALVVRSQVTPTTPTEPDERGVADLQFMLVVLAVVGVGLLLLGVKFG